ncbi:hypothetical protein Poly30_48450 [Planctomycetes bacterium Poly30]|uniref:Right handed beta helix domain-containing protein n=1 Tax=Saltatorellus ferox TaxID=2528018 RepID=A0A518EYY1_9BACT|nr:hypothetical protein Poly30_48450 [Planctomycetes bacterium Poly30]
MRFLRLLAVLTLASIPAAAQDTCLTPVLLGGGTTPINFQGMTLDTTYGNGTCVFAPTRDMWFCYVPSSSGDMRVRFNGSESGMLIQVYRGECGSLQLLGYSDCSAMGQLASATVVAGERYLIRLTDRASFPTSGTINVNEAFTPTDRRIYVDASSSGGDGSSWSNALEFLPEALELAHRSAPYESDNQQPVDVWVRRGTYRTDESESAPQGSDDRSASFILCDNVRIYGGFAGDEQHLSERVLFDPTRISFLNGSIGPQPGIEDNAYHVVRTEASHSATTVALLDGFHVTSGNANVASSSSDDAHGGGVLVASGKCVVANCTLSFNESYWGGGGAAVRAGADATFANCRFEYNRSAGGGGLMVRDATGRAYQCLFLENRATVFGGAIMAGPNAGSFEVNLATLVRNLAPTAAGMLVASGTDVRLELALFHDNSGGPSGTGDTARVNGGATLYSDYLYAPDVATSIFAESGGSSVGNNVFDLADDRPNFDLLWEDESNGNFRMGCNSYFANEGLATRRAPDAGDIDQDGDAAELTPLDLMLGERVVDSRVAPSAFEPQAVARSFCTPLPNAGYAEGARLLFYGSQRVADDRVILRAIGVPNSAGIFFVGLNPISPVMIGQGNLCVAAPIRLPLANTVGDALGRQLDLGVEPLQSLVVPGQRLYFQAWFRDSSMGAPTFNFSSGVYVDFL